MDMLSSDLLMSLFISALQSYKRDSLVRPFPPRFFNAENEKDFDSLEISADHIPPFYHIDWSDTSAIGLECLDLLKWVIKPKRFKLKFISNEKFKNNGLLLDNGGNFEMSETQFVFEILYNEQEEEKFKRVCGDSDILLAFHGSRAENFHSILHNGLCNNLNKVSLFGEGIYLSTDLRVCQTYSPASLSWEKSLLGNSMSCIAVCEVIDHPDVKCSVKRSFQNIPSATNGCKDSISERLNEIPGGQNTNTFDNSSSKCEVKTSVTNRKRSYIPGSEGGVVPDRYYVVRNDELVRVKYLLVHAPKARTDLIKQVLNGSKVVKLAPQPGAFKRFINRHRFFILMLSYIVFLVFISLLNSKDFSKWWREFSKKSDEDSAFLSR